ncbi:acyl carrier protein [Streptomyces sp. NBC_00201]|uniref:acyl carrier protein n=1 Tax=unclassified Streptomyces TaxID=2593676 RepID=UPI0022532148|nr:MULTISPECIES: acyl carrier protein [unclassified Streptomyces]MCX5245577.1 acyl carrier protein [Streptomyces sp. NBC_00201]
MTIPAEQAKPLTREEATTKVAEIFELIAAIPATDLTPDRGLVDDLGIDSLTMMEIAVTIQDELQVSVSDDKIKDLRTVGDIIDLVATAT